MCFTFNSVHRLLNASNNVLIINTCIILRISVNNIEKVNIENPE